jgi:starvation-inducible DNA-binding protein
VASTISPPLFEAGDADTNDLLIAFSRAVDKQLWFLEAHVSHGE